MVWKFTSLRSAFAAAVAGVVFGMLSVATAEASSFSVKSCVKSGRSVAACECQKALKIGTVSALEKFIHKYGRAKTACIAQASSLGIKVPLKVAVTTAVKTKTRKGNNGLGNGDEGNCSGSGCSDPTNPAHGDSPSGGGGGNGKGGGNGGGNGNGHNK